MTADHAQDKDKEIAFFDAHAEHDAYDVFTPQANERIIAAFMRLSGLPHGARVADLGCGSGVFTELLRRQGFQSVGLDISPKLIELGRRKFPGLELIEGDAENLPFARNSFDLVTCRIAPHHFPDGFRFVQECARVLSPGGLLLVEDHLAPDDERAAGYVNAFERLRDPSHHRTYAEYEWRGMFLDAALAVEHTETLVKPDTKLVPWAERQGCAPDTIQRLQVLLAQVPAAVAEWMRPQCVGTADAAFDHHYIILVGSKGARGG